MRFTHRAGEDQLISSCCWDALHRVLCGSGGMEPGAAQLRSGGASLGQPWAGQHRGCHLILQVQVRALSDALAYPCAGAGDALAQLERCCGLCAG